jgi:hypothetical protein
VGARGEHRPQRRSRAPGHPERTRTPGSSPVRARPAPDTSRMSPAPRRASKAWWPRRRPSPNAGRSSRGWTNEAPFPSGPPPSRQRRCSCSPWKRRRGGLSGRRCQLRRERRTLPPSAAPAATPALRPASPAKEPGAETPVDARDLALVESVDVEGVRFTAACLTHPSHRRPNVYRRSFRGLKGEEAERELLRVAWSRCSR